MRRGAPASSHVPVDKTIVSDMSASDAAPSVHERLLSDKTASPPPGRVTGHLLFCSVAALFAPFQFGFNIVSITPNKFKASRPRVVPLCTHWLWGCSSRCRLPASHTLLCALCTRVS